MTSITVHFGCRVSKDKFSILWSSDATWRAKDRQWLFFLSYQDFEYLFELSYDNTRQIELHSRAGHDAKFLLFQVLRTPKIYEKCKYAFIDYRDDQWVRTNDFTPSSQIGQSSHMCLKLPYNFQFRNFEEKVMYHEESEIILAKGLPFSKNVVLVPIVSPDGFNLPYSIQFKVSALVQNGIVPGSAVDARFFHLVDPRKRDIQCIEYALEKFLLLKDCCCYEPVRWLKKEYESQPRLPPHVALEDGLVYVRSIKITPCKVYFCGPVASTSNRVLRQFSRDLDSFLSVSFIDEDFDKLYSTVLSRRLYGDSEIKTAIYHSIKEIIKDGIVICDKHFEFLAFSSNQFRNNSLWMFARTRENNAADIRSWMGDLRQIKMVAKYAARLGQCLSASMGTEDVRQDEIEFISDVEDCSNGTKYVFSDGIGKISKDFAYKVAVKCGLKTTPSAFQIRYGGYKGVVAIDPTSSSKLSLRISMFKFLSNDTKLDVLAVSKSQPCYLNRQIIVLLSTLGVEDSAIEKKQNEAVGQWYTISTNPSKAQEALEVMSPGAITDILKEMLMCGYTPQDEPFLSMMLQVFEASKMMELRARTRIYLPNGRSMMGCLDETKTLKYGEIFVQISGSGSNQDKIIEGQVIVAKNPCLHPGDIRLLTAVKVPALKHMVDCIVFPQKGKRPHPDECSGSDLDGDVFFVCWDLDLIPPQQYYPLDYSPAPRKMVEHDVTIEEVIEHFVNYIGNGDVGLISNAHMAQADKEHYKAKSEPCLQLAKIFPAAIDYPKGGVPVTIPGHLFVSKYPDFMERTDKVSYESPRVIGRLFRACKGIVRCSLDPFTKEVARKLYDAKMEVEGFRGYVDRAFDYKRVYDTKLRGLMEYYDIKTEAEILGSCTLEASKFSNIRDDREAIDLAVSSLRKEARTWFDNEEGLSDAGADDVDAKASAWYYVTYHEEYWGRGDEGMERDHFLSFPWCVSDKLIKIKRERERTQVLEGAS